MFNILIAHNFLIEHSALIESDGHNITTAVREEDIVDLTYEKKYNLVVASIEYYDILKELKELDIIEKIIFIDYSYNLSNAKRAFGVGDDYLVEPLIVDDIKLRVEYHFRLKYKQKSTIIKYREFYYNYKQKELYRKDLIVNLSPKELLLLEILFLNQKNYIHRDEIYDYIDTQSYGTLRVYLSKLRGIGLDIIYNKSTKRYSLIP